MLLEPALRAPGDAIQHAVQHGNASVVASLERSRERQLERLLLHASDRDHPGCQPDACVSSLAVGAEAQGRRGVGGEVRQLSWGIHDEGVQRGGVELIQGEPGDSVTRVRDGGSGVTIFGDQPKRLTNHGRVSHMRSVGCGDRNPHWDENGA